MDEETIRCYWDPYTECRRPQSRTVDEIERLPTPRQVERNCHLCIMAEIARQCRLIAARQG